MYPATPDSIFGPIRISLIGGTVAGYSGWSYGGAAIAARLGVLELPVNRTVTVRTLIVVTCWTVAVGLAVLNVFVPHELGPLAVVIASAGATLYIKHRIDLARADWLTAYDAGRAVARIRSASRSSP